jgi:hypothetical protein
MKSDFKQALKDITDICKFEHWIRFYYLQQNDDQLYVDIPEEAIEFLKKEYSTLSQLAEKMNHIAITPEVSQQILGEFIGKSLDGAVHDSQMVHSVLGSKSFETEITLFHMWVDAHEDQLDDHVIDFKEWMKLFEAWKRTEKGQNMIQSLTGSTMAQEGSNLTH